MSTCANCGVEGAPDFRFCPYCGTELPAASREVEERKVVTALFCDLVGFTRLSEQHDHEMVDAFVVAYGDLTRRVVASFGGAIEKYIGDAVAAVFGFPAAHDDDPLRAVLAGLRLVGVFDELPPLGGERVRVRVGVNTGEVYARLGVDPASGETFVTGDVINTAARLQTVAPPMGVVVGELTHQLTVRAIDYDELAAADLKGKASAVRVWQARGETGPSTSALPHVSRGGLVGRHAELSTLERMAAEAATTRTQRSALIVGEPGIGKSRLVAELAAGKARGRATGRWLQGSCRPYGEGAAFSALGDAVKRFAGILETDAAELAEDRLAVAVPQSPDHEWILTRLRPLVGLAASPASKEDDFAAWTSFLRQIAASAPTTLVLEDLHWAGGDMLAFVQHLSTHGLDAPLLVIGTARTELLERHPDFLDGWPPAACLTLGPLGHGDMAELAESVAGGRLSEETARFVLQRSGGNPLFVEEYVRLLADHDLLRRTSRGIELDDDKGSPPLPDSVQAVIGARLDLLAPPLRAALSDAAVLGETFWRGGVAAVGGSSEAELAVALSELERKQLVRAVVSPSLAAETEYSFWHALVRDVAYGRLPRKVRIGKHAAAGGWVQDVAGARVGDFAEVLAYHYATAYELAAALRSELAAGLRDPAVRYLTLAGEKTEPLDGNAAERYYSRALAIVPEADVERFRLLARRADIVTMRNRAPEAIADFETAIAGLQEAGDTRAVAAAMHGLAGVLMLIGDLRFEEVLATAVALLEGEAPSPLLVEVLLSQASIVEQGKSPRQGLQLLERAVRIAEDLGMTTPPDALAIRGRARCALGDAGGLADIRLAVEAAEKAGRRVDQADLLSELAWSLVSFEGPAASLRALAECTELSRRARMEGITAQARAMAVRSLYWAGEWDTALAECGELVPILDEASDAWSLAIVRYVWSLLLLGRGDAAAARPLAERALEVAQHNPLRGVSAVYLVAAAAACGGVGEDEAAVALLDECEEVLRDKGDTVFVYLLPLAVRTATAGGHEDLARRLSVGVVPVLPFSRHVDQALRAQLLEMDGDASGAAVAYVSAAEGWHDFGIPYEEAQALLGAGRCLSAVGDEGAASDPLERARRIFAGLGAEPDLAETDDILRRPA